MEKLRIVTTGLAVTYPFGGVFWDYIQYVLGLTKLGHDVLYLEDTGKWCYDPRVGTFVEDGSANAAAFGRHIAQLNDHLAHQWAFRDVQGRTYGRSWSDVVQFCRSADLLLNISAACWLRDEHCTAKRTAFVDTDPGYTQAALLFSAAGEQSLAKLNWYKQHHDVFFTFGENIGREECLIPTAGIEWLPTRQPVVLDCFRSHSVPVSARRPLLTTVASWEPAESGPIINGVAYSGKSTEFLRFLDLPRRSPLPIEVGLSGPAPAQELQRNGWLLRNGFEISCDPWIYRHYLADCVGECSVAKNTYVATRSGWFSCRTACYLALGVPAIVQDTGFSRILPTGEGLIAFTTADEASAGISQVCESLNKHASCAQGLAEEYFDSSRILTRLIDDAFARHA